MRSLDEARPSWAELRKLGDLQQLRTLVADAPPGSAVTSGQRSICWKAFLLFETLDRAKWPTTLADSRAAYVSLRTHFLYAIEHPDEVDFVLDPLSDNQESPWNALRADEALREEIFQDVERCMPENVYFRQPETQKMLLDILFIFCKLNPDVGYRQGMHEVLAPILWVVERDALDPASLKKTASSQDDVLLMTVLNHTQIEHDTFTIFGLVMQNAKSFYELPGNARPSSQSSAGGQNESAMLARCRKIFEFYLPRVDPGLADHLQKIDVVPQIFLLRWIRLLFGREFPLDDVLCIWDLLFAEDTTLNLVDLISVSMLLRIRWKLIDADTSTALTLLLHYPEPSESYPPRTFVKDALYLKKHLNPEGGSHIVTKYTERPLPVVPRLSSHTPRPQQQPRISGRSAHRITTPPVPSHRKSPSAGLENIIQDAARGVYSQGERWGLNKAVRDAASSVRKNIADLQSTQSSPRMKFPGFLVTSLSSDSDETDMARVERLEHRNKTLAKMLENAVGDLWTFQKGKAENEEQTKDALEKLSVAVGTVQLVQVYLDDSSIPLPPEESHRTRSESTSTASAAQAEPASGPSAPPTPNTKPIAPSSSRQTGSGQSQQPATSSTPPPTLPARRKESRAAIRGSAFTPALISGTDSGPAEATRTASTESSSRTLASAHGALSRPALAQSSFSWMLGQEDKEKDARETFGSSSRYLSSAQLSGAAVAAKEAAAKEDRRRGKGYLFGEEEWEMEGSGSGT